MTGTTPIPEHKQKKPDIWKEEIIYTSQRPGCKHNFEFVSGSIVECVNCKMGLVGVYDLKDGLPIT